MCVYRHVSRRVCRHVHRSVCKHVCNHVCRHVFSQRTFTLWNKYKSFVFLACKSDAVPGGRLCRQACRHACKHAHLHVC